MTLAEYMAVIWIINKDKASDMAPVIGLIPEYARRSGIAIEAVWNMPAERAVSFLLNLLPDLITESAAVQVQESAQQMAAIIDPKKIVAAVATALASARK